MLGKKGFSFKNSNFTSEFSIIIERLNLQLLKKVGSLESPLIIISEFFNQKN